MAFIHASFIQLSRIHDVLRIYSRLSTGDIGDPGAASWTSIIASVSGASGYTARTDQVQPTPPTKKSLQYYYESEVYGRNS